MYNGGFPWQPKIVWLNHISPADHSSFYCSAKLNLNVTRQAMADNGFCPSGRLFEAAACGVALLSDWWEGLDLFLTPGEEILIANNTEQAIEALETLPENLARIGRAARERTLEQHTADARVREFERILNTFRQPTAMGVA